MPFFKNKIFYQQIPDSDCLRHLFRKDRQTKFQSQDHCKSVKQLELIWCTIFIPYFVKYLYTMVFLYILTVIDYLSWYDAVVQSESGECESA